MDGSVAAATGNSQLEKSAGKNDAEKVEESLRDFIGRVGKSHLDNQLLRTVPSVKRATRQV